MYSQQYMYCTTVHVTNLLCKFSQGLSYSAELKGVHHLLLKVDKMLACLSPVVIIQRWVRGWLCRCHLARSNNQKIRLGLRFCIVHLTAGSPWGGGGGVVVMFAAQC